MRLIDADAFRKELDNHWPFTKEEQSKHGIADMAKSTLLEVLHNMSPIELPHWIPCSEKLPKIEETGVSMMVLLCWSDGQVTVGAYAGDRTFVGQAWPKAKGANVRVVAWMPLPEPYGGESE